MRRLIAGIATLAIAAAAASAVAAAAAPSATAAPAATPATAAAPAPAAASAPIAAAPGAASVENTTIGELLDKASSKAVIQKDLPELIAYPGLDQIKGMTLRAISAFPEAKLDDAKLAAMQKDFDAAKKP